MAFLFNSPLSQAQQQISMVSGTVRDAQDNIPLQGATVRIKLTEQSAVTGQDGSFKLNTRLERGTLVVTFIGYKPVEVVFTGSQNLNIALSRDLGMLQEIAVVSTGYQTISKERAVGSFDQIDNKLVMRSTSTGILERLNGVTSGLRFNGTATNNIATNPNNRFLGINIRGEASLSGNVSKDPLIVLDNFPYDGNMANLNPNDVESITVLKDAAAASIWGARAGNGVIVITTKKGRKNQPLQVDFSSNVTVSARPDLYYDRNFLPSPDYIQVESDLFSKGYFDTYLNDARGKSPISPVVDILDQVKKGIITSDQGLGKIADLKQLDVRRQYEQYAYQRAVKQQYALGMRGGSSQNSYNFSVGYDKNMDDHIRNGFDRLSVNFNNVYSPLKNLDVTTAIYYSRNNTIADNQIGYQAISVGGPVAGIYPYAQFADAAGNHLPLVKGYRQAYVNAAQGSGFLDWQYKPLDELALGDMTTKVDELILKGGIRYKIVPHLQVELQFQNERQTVNSRNYQAAGTYAARDLVNRFTLINPTTGAKTYQAPVGGILNLGNYLLNTNSGRLQFSYTNQFSEKSELSAFAGAEVREASSSSFQRNSLGYNDQYGTSTNALNYSDYLAVNPYGSAQLPSPSGSVSAALNRYVSYFSNISYTYDGRYTLNLSGRKDGANIFGVKINDRITPLWSAGLGWDVSKEKFYSLNWLPYLKGRVSYGYNGNVYNGSAYVKGTYLTSSLTGATIITNLSAPNPELSWEKVKNINFGFDFASKNSRVTGTVEYFIKNGEELIQTIPLFSSSGFLNFIGNAASTHATGFDITLNSRNLTGRFKWNSTVLLSTLKDKVTAYDVPFIASTITQNAAGGVPSVGRSLYGIYAYQWRGLDPANGDPQGLLAGKVSKDYTGIINNYNPDSLKYMGSARPTIYGSFRNDFSYNNFTLSANMTYEFGFVFRRGSTSINEADLISSAFGQHIDYEKRWQQPGDETKTNVPSLAYPSNNNRNTFYQYSEALIEKGANIRLQDIRLSYDLTRKQYPGLPFQGIQVFAYASNLGIIRRANHAGLDPDVVSFYAHGIPNPFTIAFGFNLHL